VNRVTRNIIANLAGNTWAALMSIVFVPIYIKLIGMEAYGLIGFFASIQATTAIMDFGLSTMLNRELAALSVREGTGREMRDLVKTLGTVYAGIGLAIGAVFLTTIPWLAKHWFKADTIAVADVEQCLLYMGIGILLGWPVGLYSGGILGLQKIVQLNVILAIFSGLRSAGAILVLLLISRKIQIFFAWQAAVGGLQAATLFVVLWLMLPRTGESAVFRFELIRRRWRFAAGLTGSSIMGVILTQLDKLILSTTLSLERYSYYVLAGSVSQSLYRLITPVSSALFPRFSVLVSEGQTPALENLYHKGTQLMSVILMPIMAVVIFFSRDLLFLWTGNPEIAERSHTILTLLVIGTTANGLMNLPVALQWAHKWTKLHFLASVVAVLILAPLITILSVRYGGPGAAIGWLVFNIGYVSIVLRIMHKRLLPGAQRKWYTVDVGLPMVTALIVAGACRFGIDCSHLGTSWFVITVTGVVTAAATVVSAPELMIELRNIAGRRNAPCL
jgi:O-antigen/teichoic acid export membrane protein